MNTSSEANNTKGAGPVGRIMRNARALLSGKAVGGVLSLAYLAIAARAGFATCGIIGAAANNLAV